MRSAGVIALGDRRKSSEEMEMEFSRQRTLQVTSATAYVPRRVRVPATPLGALLPPLRCRSRQPGRPMSGGPICPLGGAYSHSRGVSPQVVASYEAPLAPQPPCAAPLRCVFLFADVSGFTRLTRVLADQYEEGPWATSLVLNRVRELLESHSSASASSPHLLTPLLSPRLLSSSGSSSAPWWTLWRRTAETC